MNSSSIRGYSEYPDPDVAAHTTTYPWREVNNPQITTVGDDHFPSVQLNNELEWETEHGREIGNPDSSPSTSSTESDVEFSVHEVERSEDDYISDDEPNEPSQAETETRSPVTSRDMLASNRLCPDDEGAFHTSSVRRTPTSRNDHIRIEVQPSIVRRGYRKPMEPGPEVMKYVSEATMALAGDQLEKAEELTLQALRMNPEVFQAHNLLSEIHAARGDIDKSISVAWNGAHTRPRDIRMWKRVAALLRSREDSENDECLKDALYCYSRIVAVDRYNIEARYERAAINRQLGYPKKAVVEYEFMLKYLLPHDTAVLRNLAAVCNEVDDSRRALEHYESALDAAQEQASDDRSVWTWSDIDVLAELYILSQMYSRGLIQVKRGSRFLLGRSKEKFWDDVVDDDREWDIEDTPRRIAQPAFEAGGYDQARYGAGLPLKIRVKLGILRLSLGRSYLSEAILHFRRLELDGQATSSGEPRPVNLFREVGIALRLHGLFDDALPFLKAACEFRNGLDVQLLMDLAFCYRAVGLDDEARSCYEEIVVGKPEFTEARVALWNMTKALPLKAVWRQRMQPPTPVAKPAQKGRPSKSAAKSNHATRLSSGDPLVVRSKRKRKSGAQSKDLAGEINETHALHQKWRTLRSQVASDDSALRSWLEASNLLLQTFSDCSRHGNHSQSHAERTKQTRGWSRSTKVVDQSSDQGGKDPVIAKSTGSYSGLSLTEWLDVSLEYSLEVARLGESQLAYQCLTGALRTKCFASDADAVLAINTTWFACALLTNDEETISNVARWFMARFQFVSDAYRLFTALNRLCESKNQLFNSSPIQKFILRQLKAIDFGLSRKTDFDLDGQQRHTPRVVGRATTVSGMNSSLLMLYGHMLYAGRSFSYAINYFLRAQALDKDNPVVKFSLALAYLHWALKRQADNRHDLLLQGMAFLLEYYDDCQEMGDPYVLQEAEFNMGRTYQMLGLTNLAVLSYARCLNLGERYRSQAGLPEAGLFVEEASIALSTIHAANGDFQKARDIASTWLVL